MKKTEYFPIVDDSGLVIGKASRQDCHSGSFLLHPVVHLHVMNNKKELYLQKRSPDKDIQPGKWDTSVGGHVDYGEDIENAILRESGEELSISNIHPIFLHKYKFVSEVEAELVHSYYIIYDGEIHPDPVEISEGRFWTLEEILQNTGKNIFTPNFESEFKLLMDKNLLPF
jgi:isopentenyldiphosphate isomerase